MPLGTEINLGTDDVVLDWIPAPPPLKGAQPPVFGSCLLWPNGWMDEDATWYRTRPRPSPHCIRRGPSSPRERGTAAPPLFGPCLLWPQSPISATNFNSVMDKCQTGAIVTGRMMLLAAERSLCAQAFCHDVFLLG